MNNKLTIPPNHVDILNNFQNHITSFFKLNQEIIEEICNRFQVQILPKKTLLVNFGQINNRIYFIHSGILRGFYLEDGKEITNWFAKSSEFIYCPQKYQNIPPTNDAIETLEDSVLLSITTENLSYLYTHFPETAIISQQLAQYYLHHYDRKIRLLRIPNAEKRVKTFIELYPKAFLQLPHKYLSSFLGLAPETFSRIMTRKN